MICTPTLHVLSIRARRAGRRIHYRMVGENELEPWTISPDASRGTLTLREVYQLIQTASHPTYPADGRPLDDRIRADLSIDKGRHFVHVESELYVGLAECFMQNALDWASARDRQDAGDA